MASIPFIPVKATYDGSGNTVGFQELKPTESVTVDNLQALTANGSITINSNIVMAAGTGITYAAPSSGPAAQGFGVGIYPGTLPTGFTKKSAGTDDITSDDYGNYQYGVSVMCWIPKFYYRWGNSSSKLYSIYGANSLEIVYAATSGFANTTAANAAGYVLHRAFIDGGAEKDGFFIDKYQWSNPSGIAASVKNGAPLSSDSAHNPFSGLNGAPTNYIGAAFAVAKTRGADFFPCSIFQFKALAYLSLAHAQACKANNVDIYCAWADLSNINAAKNYPRGNNNNSLSSTPDIDSASTLRYGSDGYYQCGLTGSGSSFNLTTHNGQACGVADLNGNMLEITPGITSDATSFYVLKESVAMKSLTGGNTLPTDAWGANGITTNYTPVGATIGGGASNRIGSGTSAIFSSATAGNDRDLASAGVPLVTSAGGVQYMGADYFSYGKPNELCPLSGGSWTDGAGAGVWALNIADTRGNSRNYVGGRSGLYI